MNVVIIDAGLNLKGGHHSSFLKRTLSLLGDVGKIRILTNAAIDPAGMPGLDVAPVLSSTGYEPSVAPGDERADGPERFAPQSLALDFLKCDDWLASATQILVLNATPVVIAAVHIWLRLRGAAIRATVSIYMLTGVGVKAFLRSGRLRFVVYDPARRRRLRGDFAAVGGLCGSLSVYASSLLRREGLRRLGAVDDARLYTLFTTSFRLSDAEGEPTANTVLLYVGDAKSEKGFCQLPALAAFLTATFPHLRFIAHANDPQSRFASVGTRLRALARRSANFSLREGYLADCDYDRLLSDAALVVLLHERDYYYDMESGIGRECLVRGFPFVCLKGTLMADEMILLGGETFCYENASDIAQLTARILASYASFRSDFALLRARFRKSLEGAAPV